MTSIDDVEISPSRAFGIDRLPHHPVMKVLGYGVGEDGATFVEIEGFPTKFSLFGDSGPCEYDQAGTVTTMTTDELTIWGNHLLSLGQANQRPLSAEMMQIVDFCIECGGLGDEVGGTPTPPGPEMPHP